MGDSLAAAGSTHDGQRGQTDHSTTETGDIGAQPVSSPSPGFFTPIYRGLLRQRKWLNLQGVLAPTS